MNKKILFCAGEGIGNVVQMIPCIRTLKEVLNYTVDFWWIFGSYVPAQKLIPYVDRWILGNQIVNLNSSDYCGKIITFWAKDYINAGPLSRIIPLNNKIHPMSMEKSEVDVYMNIARELGAKEEDLLWYGECNYNKIDENYDVVIHNGFNKHSPVDWSVKSYPHYEKMVEYLEGLSVCSIGAENEYIEGTENKTGLPLLDTLGLIKNCRIFVGNDSGLYHCANALGVDNIVIFTATSIEKNFDARFHKFSSIVCRDDLECRPCQAGRKWLKSCDKWECQNVSPEVILNTIKTVITARFMADFENEREAE